MAEDPVDAAAPAPVAVATPSPPPTAVGGGAKAPSATPVGPLTLAIDIGGTGLKASVLDAEGAMVADRVIV
jgi:hypothetical protein